MQRFPSVSLAVLFGSLCPPSHSLSFLSPRSALCPASFPESPSALALFSFLALSCFSILALPPSLPLSFSSGQRASSSSLAPSQLLSSSSPPLRLLLRLLPSLLSPLPLIDGPSILEGEEGKLRERGRGRGRGAAKRAHTHTHTDKKHYKTHKCADMHPWSCAHKYTHQQSLSHTHTQTRRQQGHTQQTNPNRAEKSTHTKSCVQSKQSLPA